MRLLPVVMMLAMACGDSDSDTDVDLGTDTDAGSDTGTDTDVDTDAPVECASGTQTPALWIVSSGDNRLSDAGTYGAVVSPAPTVAGQVGEAIGQGELVAITPDGIDDLWPGTGGMTLEAWLWVPDAERPDQLTLYSHRNCAFTCSGGAPGSVRLGLLEDDVVFELDNSVDRRRTSLRGTLQPETWHHVAGVRRVTGTSQVVELYIDGTMVSSEPYESVEIIADQDDEREPISINFVYSSGGADPLGVSDAIVDELGYHLTALSADEIATLAAAPDGRCEHPERELVACSDDYEWTDGNSLPPVAPTDGSTLVVGGNNFRDGLSLQAGLTGMHRVTATAADGTDLRIRHFTSTGVVEGIGVIEFPVATTGRIPFVVEPADPVNRCVSYTVTAGIAD